MQVYLRIAYLIDARLPVSAISYCLQVRGGAGYGFVSSTRIPVKN